MQTSSEPELIAANAAAAAEVGGISLTRDTPAKV